MGRMGPPEAAWLAAGEIEPPIEAVLQPSVLLPLAVARVRTVSPMGRDEAHANRRFAAGGDRPVPRAAAIGFLYFLFPRPC